MSTSSRTYDDTSRVELPVFVSPVDLVFALNKRRSLVTIYNPYESEAQFKLLTTSPNRFDVNITKGVIKPRRCMDVAIRLLQESIDELPDAYEEPQVIDHFRVSLQIGSLRGSKAVRVLWCTDAELLENQNSSIAGSEEKLAKTKTKTPKPPQLTGPVQRAFINPRLATSQNTARSHIDRVQDKSNVNLVCTICAIICVIILFLPSTADHDSCKKSRVPTLDPQNVDSQSMTLMTQLTTLLSVSQEMKLGCSFALGLFTYRLISTLPE